MKGFKKVLTGILAATMIMGASLNVAASTEGTENLNTSTITIDANENQAGDKADGTVNVTYTYYEVLKATINGDAFSYYLDNNTKGTALKNLLDAVKIGEGENAVDAFTFTLSADESRWILSNSEDAAKLDGEALATALLTDEIKAAALSSANFVTNKDGSATATGLEKGYYLITSTLGTKLVLGTLDDEISIKTKNSYPTNVKTASKTNMKVGDTVTYTIEVTIPASSKVGEEVTVHDTLDAKLQFLSNTLVAKVGNDTVTLTDGTKKETTETFAKKFTITEAMLGKSVVVKYDAELLSTAADANGYVNEVVTNTSSYETLPSEVRVWTFAIEVDKNFAGIDGDAQKDYVATFEMKAAGTDGKATGDAFAFVVSADGKTYTKADSDDTNTVNVITINGLDNVKIVGLDEGAYVLTELTTMDGFNLLTAPAKVSIEDTTPEKAKTDETIVPSCKVTWVVGDSSGEDVVTILNNSGVELPSTGGIGTTIFYLIGGLLIVSAAVFFVVRRKAE